MPTFAAADWLIVLIYCFFALTAGFSLRPVVTGSRQYLQAGRALPGWLCGLAMVGAGLGSETLLGLGAAGARYGIAEAGFFALGSIPALLFTALYLMPLYYGSQSGPRTIPDYLGRRFDQKTRALNAGMFLGMAAFGAGISLYAMARIFEALHLFDQMANRLSLPPSGSMLLAMMLPAALVLTYVLLGGLGAAMYNQALQFCVIVAGLLPAVLLGLKRIGGWSGLKAAAPAGFFQEWSGAAHAGAHSMSIGAIGMALGAGLVVGGGIWCTDFRLLQTAMAAKDVQSARRAPLIAAAVWVILPLLLILPGAIAIGLPTPHTTEVVRNENGTIYHEINVVPAAVEAGLGLVPAKADAATGKPVMGANGHAVLDYAMATPNMLAQFLPMGLLGLGIAVLLGCLMSGVAAGVTAFSAVFTCDIFEAFIAKNADDKRLLLAGRWSAAGGMVLAIGTACAAMRFVSLLDAMVLVFAVVNAPLFAVLYRGALWKRMTGHGAFAGLIAGMAAALLNDGLMLPAGAQRGIHGGWIAVLGRPSSDLALGLENALAAFFVSLIVSSVVSRWTKPRPDEELRGLVRSLTELPPARAAWWKRPEMMAAAILVAAIAVNLILM